MPMYKGLSGAGFDLARVIWWILLIILTLPLVWTYLTGPKSPLPDHLNPQRPFDLSDPQSPWTMYKFRRALADPQACLAALDTGASARSLTAIDASENCSVPNRVSLTRVGDTGLSNGGVETACTTALRMAAWERYGLQPAARDVLGTSVARIDHIGSYNCRVMRTTQGSTRWSTHATADAIDIAGFGLADGRTIRLLRDWNDDDADAEFLRAAHQTSCTWFATTLGPDYNALHADHFHLQSRGWGTCR